VPNATRDDIWDDDLLRDIVPGGVPIVVVPTNESGSPSSGSGKPMEREIAYRRQIPCCTDDDDTLTTTATK
jgi:hypothetical protein